MNLKNILWARNTGAIVPDAPIADNLFGLKLSGGSGVITTATGNPVSIVTNKAQNALDLQIAFSPKQSGSGTPSPDNIRPIVPWTSLTLTKNGTDTSYLLGGSYYGGTLDVVTGELTVTHAIKTYKGSSGEVWNYSERGGNRRVFIVLDEAKASATDFWANIASGGADSSYPDPWKMRTNSNTRPSLIIGVDNTISSADDWKALLANTNMIVVYPLAEPITVSLTPAEVALLAGNNTLATDGDSLSVTYMAKK